MPADPVIVDLVVDFYQALFKAIFVKPFSEDLRRDRLKRDAMSRQVEEVANAASQSVVRLFTTEEFSEGEARAVLAGWERLEGVLGLSDVSTAGSTPEELTERLLERLGCPAAVAANGLESLYRFGLHGLIQSLMLIGPVLAEWRRLSFSQHYEPVRKVVSKLDDISEKLALGVSGLETIDERYELSYRDFLLQRFNRVEAGTVRMTTNMDVDLRELFVMPQMAIRDREREGAAAESCGDLMKLAEARKSLGDHFGPSSKGKQNGRPVLDLVRECPRLVIVGPPGSGKSSFLEWLQLQIAGADEELVLAGQQAIPLLLRVRQLDARALPKGNAMIEKATGSRELITIMPNGWLDRQMKAGRVLVMIDGLDETDPALRAEFVLPWLESLCEEYPACGFIVSSRPVGYAEGAFSALGFVEGDLLDFTEAQVEEYAQHWCTAIRLGRNEPEEEAREKGRKDGTQIVASFQSHVYVRNLASNPLMLSAICLVNYFESGKLPEDRARLYQLCVEGLLHNWDKRRDIHGDFDLPEKLRVCREIAIAMQSADRAEGSVDESRQIAVRVLGDKRQADELIEHIRYRTGLLVERRPGVFAFAHLTFQEYLAALAVHEGNLLDVTTEQLVREHDDVRWHEVIALYCGLAPVPAARRMLIGLIEQSNTVSLSRVLTEAYFATGRELPQDADLRNRIIYRVASAPGRRMKSALNRFVPSEVAAIANEMAGRATGSLSEAYVWLRAHKALIDSAQLWSRIKNREYETQTSLGELTYLVVSGFDATSIQKLDEFVSFLGEAVPPFEPAGEYKGVWEVFMVAFGANEALSRAPQLLVERLMLRLLRLESMVRCNGPSPYQPNAMNMASFAQRFRTLSGTALKGEERSEFIRLARSMRDFFNFSGQSSNILVADGRKAINAWLLTIDPPRGVPPHFPEDS